MINGLNFLFLGTFGWGISLFLIKILLVTFTPFEIVFYRVVIGAGFLILLCYLLEKRINNWWYLLYDGLILAIFNIALPFYLTTWAETAVSSSLASIINGLVPIMTFVLGLLFFGVSKKCHWMQVGGLLLGFLGIIIINAEFNFNQQNIWPLLALLSATISYALAANYMKTFAKTTEPLLSAAMGMSLSVGCLLLLNFCVPGFSLAWHRPEFNVQFGALTWLGLVGSGLSLFLYCWLIDQVGALKASLVTYLMTLTGVVAGMYILKESLSWQSGLGCIIILFSLVLINHVDTILFMFRKLYSQKKSDKAFQT